MRIKPKDWGVVIEYPRELNVTCNLKNKKGEPVSVQAENIQLLIIDEGQEIDKKDYSYTVSPSKDTPGRIGITISFSKESKLLGKYMLAIKLAGMTDRFTLGNFTLERLQEESHIELRNGHNWPNGKTNEVRVWYEEYPETNYKMDGLLVVLDKKDLKKVETIVLNKGEFRQVSSGWNGITFFDININNNTEGKVYKKGDTLQISYYIDKKDGLDYRATDSYENIYIT